ncbi:MAG: hypothetical protein LBB18_00995 [Puniceicoccales bacterium]|jgi:hypothetical protein|nr:hypothetical protein [Puniceicoccales bacterium]
MLNNFLKNSVGVEYEGVVENCTLNSESGNEVYIEMISNESVFVWCAINGVQLNDADEDFYKHLLEENSDNNRDISPLYWSIDAEKRAISCSGFVIFDDPLAYEEELYALVGTLIGCKLDFKNDDVSEDKSTAGLSVIVNKV